MKKYIDAKNNSYGMIESQNIYGNDTACEEALYNLKWPGSYTSAAAIIVFWLINRELVNQAECDVS